MINRTLIDMLTHAQEELFQLDDAAFISLMQTYMPESLFMKGKANATVESRGDIKPKKNFHGLTEDEEIRAFSGLLRLKEVLVGTQEAYDKFVACQKEMKKPLLSYESFLEMQKYVLSILKTPEDFAAAMWSILCNDLGKVQSLVDEYNKLPDKTPVGHDLMLSELLKAKPEMFEGFSLLPVSYQEDIIASYATGCDISMYEQFELPPVSLTALTTLNKKALDFYILHTIFDVAGAAAHFKQNGSLTMHQETWDFFNETRKGLEKIHDSSVEEVYAEYVAYRAERIGIHTGLACDREQVTALTRIAGLSRLATKEQGGLLLSAWHELPQDAQNILVKELNVHGGRGLRAIFIGYGQAILLNAQMTLNKMQNAELKAQGLVATPEQVRQANQEGLKIGMLNLAAIFSATRKVIRDDATPRIFVAGGADIAQFLAINHPRESLEMNLSAVRETERRLIFKFVPREPEEAPESAPSEAPQSVLPASIFAPLTGYLKSFLPEPSVSPKK